MHILIPLRDEDLIIPESMTQDFGCTGVLETQAHSKLRNCFSGAAVQSKDMSDSGIIELSFLSNWSSNGSKFTITFHLTQEYRVLVYDRLWLQVTIQAYTFGFT